MKDAAKPGAETATVKATPAVPTLPAEGEWHGRVWRLAAPMIIANVSVPPAGRGRHRGGRTFARGLLPRRRRRRGGGVHLHLLGLRLPAHGHHRAHRAGRRRRRRRRGPRRAGPGAADRGGAGRRYSGFAVAVGVGRVPAVRGQRRGRDAGPELLHDPYLGGAGGARQLRAPGLVRRHATGCAPRSAFRFS